MRLLGARAEAFKALIQKYIDRKVLVPSQATSGWTSRAFLVPKPDGRWRLVVDYRELNNAVVDDGFPLPVTEDLIGAHGKEALWSVFDLEDGFYQMHLDPASQDLTTFCTPWGVYHWVVLPMGLKTSPSAYQRMVGACLSGFSEK